LIRSRAKRTPWPHGLAATSAAPIAVRFPAHLPRVDVTITPEDTNCPCCRAPMHVIGEETSQRLDVVPAQFRVIVTHRRSRASGRRARPLTNRSTRPIMYIRKTGPGQSASAGPIRSVSKGRLRTSQSGIGFCHLPRSHPYGQEARPSSAGRQCIIATCDSPPNGSRHPSGCRGGNTRTRTARPCPA
jgi:hypothetical protein